MVEAHTEDGREMVEHVEEGAVMYESAEKYIENGDEFLELPEQAQPDAQGIEGYTGLSKERKEQVLAKRVQI